MLNFAFEMLPNDFTHTLDIAVHAHQDEGSVYSGNTQNKKRKKESSIYFWQICDFMKFNLTPCTIN